MDEDFLQAAPQPEVDTDTAWQERAARTNVEDPEAMTASVTYGALVRLRKQFATYLLGGAHRKDPLDPNLDPVVHEMVIQFRPYRLHRCNLCSAIAPCHLGICAWGCEGVMMWPLASSTPA